MSKKNYKQGISFSKEWHTLNKSKIIDETASICEFCQKVIPAKIVEIGDNVYLEKDCCGKRFIITDRDIDLYKTLRLPFKHQKNYLDSKGDLYWKDIEKKELEEASVISLCVTTRCDQNCTICYAKDMMKKFPGYDMPLGKLKEIVGKYKSKYMTITGGEPTMRDDLAEIIRIVRESGNIPSVTTNGFRFTDKEYAKNMRNAGLKDVNLSFDGFDDEIYIRMRNKPYLEEKLLALENLKRFGFRVWFNVVVASGVNEGEIAKILEFAYKNTDFIRGFGLIGLNIGDSYDFTHSELYKMVTNAGGFSIDDIQAEKRFRYTFYLFLSRIFNQDIMRRFNHLKDDVFYMEVKDGNGAPLLNSKDYDNMSDVIEKSLTKRTRLGTITTIILNLHEMVNKKTIKLIVPLFASLLKPSKASQMVKPDILKFYVRPLKSQINLDLMRNDGPKTESGVDYYTSSP